MLPEAPWRRVWECPAPSSCSPSPGTLSQLLWGGGCLRLEVELVVLLGSWKLQLSQGGYHSLAPPKSPPKACPLLISSHR